MRSLVIGLFGLVGIVGVAMMPLIGRAIDGLIPWSATLFGISMLLVTFGIQTAAAGLNVAVIVIVTIGLDCFRQMQQVSLTTAVLALDSNARSRLNACINVAVRLPSVPFICSYRRTNILTHSSRGWCRRSSGR